MKSGITIAPGLKQGLSQSLVMTPQLVQAIKLLQMSHQELLAHVETELEQNPFLERHEGENPGAAEEGADQDLSAPLEITQLELPEQAERMEAAPDTDYSNVYQDEVRVPDTSQSADSLSPTNNFDSHSGSSPAMSDADFPTWDARIADVPTLTDHLEQQLGLLTQDPLLLRLSMYLAGQLDGAGYLNIDENEIRENFAISQVQLDDAIALLQQCDPCGIGARNLQECLRIQLKEAGQLNGPMEIFLQNLDLIGSGQFDLLRQKCGLDETALSQMLGHIRRTNPKPGERFFGPEPESLIPDVIVTPAAISGPDADDFWSDQEEHSRWRVEINADVLPRLLINESYFKIVSKSAKSEEKSFLSTSFQSASGLIKALDQRAKSILNVATEIVRVQEAFLDHGIAHLKPMTLKQVGDAIDLHESTVSRVTANKYMSTPRGIFEMKFFFSSSISGADGESFSGEAVRHRIRQLINHEEPERVFSDDALVERLKSDGIDIARRTVAKYREAMGIPSSNARRREKRARLSEQKARQPLKNPA